jgi:hypothetical protein
MITTIDDNTNGFRHELIPIALSSSEASSQGLLEATLALSSFHLGKQEEALMHKVKAINSLSKSFNGQNASRIAQFSACMMLCVYSVGTSFSPTTLVLTKHQVFDASDTTWNVHLQGAKTLSQSFSPQERNMPGLAFLDSWLEYHDTFAAYSHRCQSPGPRVEDILLPESSPTNQKVSLIHISSHDTNAHMNQIIGLLGCSTELIRLISCINQLRTLMPLPRLSPLRSTVADLAHAIHERLLHIKQEVFIQAEDNAEMDICHSRITLTAELYRLATLLYLHQTLSPSYSLPIAQIENDSYITAALAVLDQMEICSSPWPLFIIANAVSDDADRIKIMGFVVHGARSRQIGNYGIIANLIEAVWKQRDLTADGKEERRVDWRDVVGGEGGMPSFI